MAGQYHHEEIARGKDAVARLHAVSITVCGAGALGSNLVDTLARTGFQQLTVIDDDRVEEHNISTQRYGRSNIGQLKVAALNDVVYDATGVELFQRNKRLDASNSKKLLRGADLVVDCLDNSAARAVVQAAVRSGCLPCVHAGLNDGYGQVTWDERYKVPADVDGDVCDYPLSRNIISLTVTVLAEAIICYFLGGQRRNFAITLGDLRVMELVGG